MKNNKAFETLEFRTARNEYLDACFKENGRVSIDDSNRFAMAWLEEKGNN